MYRPNILVLEGLAVCEKLFRCPLVDRNRLLAQGWCRMLKLSVVNLLNLYVVNVVLCFLIMVIAMAEFDVRFKN
jgi:hypothetical protein